jgi:hypothetical protein
MHTVFSLLNQDAKAWWFHKKLREQGQEEEARMKERESIRRGIHTIRGAFLYTVGRGGWTVHGKTVASGAGGSVSSKLSGYGEGTLYSALLARARPSVPRVDSRCIPDSEIIRVLRLPIITNCIERQEPCDENGAWGGFQYAPLGVILASYEALGAQVYWGNWEREYWRSVAIPTVNRILAGGESS